MEHRRSAFGHASTTPDVSPTPETLRRTIQNQFERWCAVWLSAFGFVFIPSFLREGYYIPPENRKETAFLDGLRGFSAFTVYMDHLLTPIYPHLRHGYGNSDTSCLLQLPFLRLLYSGDSMVATFFVISGAVLSKKTIEHIQEGDMDRVLDSLAASTFKRGVRLYLPPILSTFIVMLMCRANLFDDSLLRNLHAPHPIRLDSWRGQFLDWTKFVLDFLISPWRWYPSSLPSNYGNHLWTITIEMSCSLRLFITLLCLARLKRKFSLAVGLLLMASNFLIQRHPLALFYFGMLQIQNIIMVKTSKFRWASGLLGLFILLFGFYLSSFPPIPTNIPYGLFNTQTYWAIGAASIFSGLCQLQLAQDLLETCVFQYFGKISFALYICHEPILQIFGWRLLRAAHDASRREGQGGVSLVIASFMLLTAAVLFISDIFWRCVDLPSIRFANWLRKKAWTP